MVHSACPPSHAPPSHAPVPRPLSRAATGETTNKPPAPHEKRATPGAQTVPHPPRGHEPCIPARKSTVRAPTKIRGARTVHFNPENARFAPPRPQPRPRSRDQTTTNPTRRHKLVRDTSTPRLAGQITDQAHPQHGNIWTLQPNPPRINPQHRFGWISGQISRSQARYSNQTSSRGSQPSDCAELPTRPSLRTHSHASGQSLPLSLIHISDVV